jgi:alkylation response protein AidB-like acyl-CoA dehydrogenase
VPTDNLVGELNAGWMVAQTPLAFERGGSETLILVARLQEEFERLVAAAGTLRRDGTRAIDDPVTRQRLGEIYADVEVLRYAQLRLLSRAEKGHGLGPEAAVSKLHYTELDKRVQEIMLDVLGPYGQQRTGVPGEFALEMTTEEGIPGDWSHFYCWSRAGTIYAGSSEIQKNIIGERILGLPKEVRADRLLAQQRAG